MFLRFSPQSFQEVILGFGWFAPFILYILYIVFNLLILPTMFFNIFAGYLYGIGWGYLLSITGMSIGMICSFYAARYLFQDDFHKKFGDSKIVSEINRWTKKRPLLTVVDMTYCKLAIHLYNKS